jgi:uncharacterized protein (DUF1778 family)
MAQKKKPASKSSSATHKAAGRRPSLIWFDDEDRATIQAAAKAEHRPMTQFVVHHSLAAARKIVAKQ